MKRIMIAALALLAVALAVNAARSQQTGSAVPLQNYTFTLTAQEINTLAAALNELPKRIADPMIEKLRAQAVDQEKIAAEKAKAAEPKPDAPKP